jgi:signal transduction histidine kinase
VCSSDLYLTKPFSLNELILRIEKLLQKKRVAGQMEEEIKSLHASIEEKETGLKKVVHDLRNPIISIGASARRMLRRTPKPDEQKILETIYDSSLHLTKWIDGIIPSNANTKDDLREIDITSLVGQAIVLSKEASAEKSVELLFKDSPSIPFLCRHEELMLRAFVNLISNAAKYTPEGGKVEVSVTPYFTQRNQGVVEIMVKDTGIGIPTEDLNRIFEPFCRGNNAMGESGMGLGLSLVKEAVELHGGRILVDSEPQKGSTFSLLFPLWNSSERKEVGPRRQGTIPGV